MQLCVLWSEVPAEAFNYYPFVVNSMAGEKGLVHAVLTAAISNRYLNTYEYTSMNTRVCTCSSKMYIHTVRPPLSLEKVW